MPKKKPYKKRSTKGSISHVSNRGEKCWRASVSVGGKKQYLGYYYSFQEADEALVEYYTDPSIFAKSMKFSQIYDGWYAEYLGKEVRRHSRKEGHPVDPYDIERNSTFTNHRAAYAAFAELHNLKFVDINKRMVEREIRKKNPPMQRKLKVLIRFLAEYALNEEIIDGSRCYELRNVKIETPERSEKHYPFSQKELDLLWDNSSDPYIQFILMGIYSGTRPGELLSLKKSDVQLDKNCFWIHKGKTASARRVVPIHEKTKPFFENWMNLNNSEFLITRYDGKQMKYKVDYNSFLDTYWNKKLEELGILHYVRENGDEAVHLPHDMRVTFSTRWADQGLNEIYRQKIQGHSTGSVGIDIYTQPFIESLVNELNKLK